VARPSARSRPIASAALSWMRWKNRAAGFVIAPSRYGAGFRLILSEITPKIGASAMCRPPRVS